MKFKLLIFGLIGIFFYWLFDLCATYLVILEQARINIDDNLSLRSFYVFVSLLSFIFLMYFYVKFLCALFNIKSNN